MEIDGARRKLLDLASGRGVSLAELSRLIDRNSTYLQQFVRKGSPRKLEETDRRTLARFFGIDEAELGAPEEISLKTGRKAGDWVDLPRRALGASAGPGVFAGEERPIGSLRFSARWLREQGLEPAMLSVISVTGDSMAPALRDGDEILVDATPRGLRDGIHVVLLHDVLLVKRVDTSRSDRITLLSENQSYQPIEVDPAELRVVGRVVWKGGRL
ncbi:MAG TPA: S24 family peptidase [Novosphingobium sp.]|nr:S24 family peptidase [Novosphingobium sp.]